MILYFCYVWDAVRNEHIESMRQSYEEYHKKQSSRRGPRSARSNEDDRTGQEPSNDAPRQHRYELDSGFRCVLPEMPKLIRSYQLFSSVFVVCAFLKYGLLSLIHYGIFGIDKTYACFLPGRLGLIMDAAYEAPWWGVFIFGLHVVWRFTWYMEQTRLKLDCLLFLYHDRDTILDKHVALTDINNDRLPGKVAERIYLCNQLFYDRHYNDSTGRTAYAIKQYRTIKQYEILEGYSIKFRCLYVIIMAMMVVPMCVLAVHFQYSDQYYTLSYPSCTISDGSRGEITFRWPLVQKLKYLYNIMDSLDNLMFLVDGAFALVVPYSGAILLTEDLALRIEYLCQQISNLNKSIRSVLLTSDGSFSQPPLSKRFTQYMQRESKRIYTEAIDTFDQTRQVDQYLRVFVSICFFACYFFTLTILAVLIFRRHLVRGTLLVFYIYILIFINFCFIAIIFIMARPQSLSQVLYRKLSSAMALCPDFEQTKMSWRWLLEYYHSRRNTLHIFGQYYVLSDVNVLRCMSWFVTCTVILLGLIKNRQAIRGYEQSLN